MYTLSTIQTTNNISTLIYKINKSKKPEPSPHTTMLTLEQSQRRTYRTCSQSLKVTLFIRVRQ